MSDAARDDVPDEWVRELRARAEVAKEAWHNDDIDPRDLVSVLIDVMTDELVPLLAARDARVRDETLREAQEAIKNALWWDEADAILTALRGEGAEQ